MDRMKVSITDRLAGYVRKKVRSGRYNNAGEVVREALRRMEEDTRALRLAKATAADVLSDLTAQQLEDVRRRVRASIDSIEAGEYREYEGREGLKALADRVKGRNSARTRNCRTQPVQPDASSLVFQSRAIRVA